MGGRHRRGRRDPTASDLLRPDLDSFDDLFGEAGAWPGRPAEPLLPFGIMFTSGTTNKPKAVVHTHANAIWASRLGPRNIDLGPDDRYLIYLPFFHVNAQSWSFFPVLGVGATVVLTPKWSTSRFWDVVARHRITHISLMPFVMGTLAQADRPETELRVGVFGLIMPDLDRMFGIDVYAAYGMTELVSHAITGKPERAAADPLDGPRRTGLRDRGGGQGDRRSAPRGPDRRAVDAGHPGYRDLPGVLRQSRGQRLVVRGRLVQDGRHGPDGRRRQRLLPGAGQGPDQGRRRERVRPRSRGGGAAVAGVAQAAVVGKKHEWLDQVVVAFVITAPGAPPHAELEAQVIEACKGRLAEFKVPRAVYVVEEFPLGTLDKLLKNKLRDLADEQPEV